MLDFHFGKARQRGADRQCVGASAIDAGEQRIGEAVMLADRVVTMTAGPEATIKTVADVDLPHPRDLTDPAALQLQRLLRDDIATEVTRTLAAQGLEQAA